MIFGLTVVIWANILLGGDCGLAEFGVDDVIRSVEYALTETVATALNFPQKRTSPLFTEISSLLSI